MKRNPMIFGQQVSPWLLGGLGGAVLLLVAMSGREVVKMAQETMASAARVKRIRELANERGIPEAVAMAIFTIESGGAGFKDGKLVIRFEPHVFKKYSGGKEVAVLRAGQKAEWDNFTRASAIDKQAALNAISMGMAQIMGFNFKLVGFDSPEAMFNALSSSEDAQIKSFYDFVKNRGLEDAARKGDFLTFARKYNGAGQQGYDTKMATLYKKYVAQGFKGVA